MLQLLKRHLKSKTSPKYPEGGIVELPSSVHVSNVMLMSEDLGRPVRTGMAFDDKGNKKRIAKGRNIKAESI